MFASDLSLRAISRKFYSKATDILDWFPEIVDELPEYRNMLDICNGWVSAVHWHKFSLYMYMYMYIMTNQIGQKLKEPP